MSRANLLFVLLGLPLALACPAKDSDDDDEDSEDGGSGGGWDLGVDSGNPGDGGGADGGSPDGGGTDGGSPDGGSPDGGSPDGGSPDGGGADGGADGGGDGGGSAEDRDGDGWTLAEGDCDDDDEEIYPGAYDRPDDGVDQDCEDGDRSFDGIVLEPGERTTLSFDVALSGGASVDLALLLDTTGSMTDAINALDATDIAAALEGSIPDLQVGLALFQDYYFDSYGSSGDKPFELAHGMTTDLADIDLTLSGLDAAGGNDGPESSMEALYQALTGDGYDMDCASDFDISRDVPPFLASDSDAFGGGGGESYDPDTPGIGTLGGMGFREGATSVLVLITDNYLRDPEAGYGTPGGCPLDAGASDVLSAASALDAFVIGLGTLSLPLAQMESLAEDGGWLVDADGDGRVDDPAVWEVDPDLLNDGVVEAVQALVDGGSLGGLIDLLLADASSDPLGIVNSVVPDRLTAVDPVETPVQRFEVNLRAPSTVEAMVQTEVEVEVRADGVVVATEVWAIELAPTR